MLLFHYGETRVKLCELGIMLGRRHGAIKCGAADLALKIFLVARYQVPRAQPFPLPEGADQAAARRTWVPFRAGARAG